MVSSDSNRSGSSGPPAVRVWLRFGDHDVELPPGETIVGRSPKCQLVIDDALVSRSHARLVVNRGAVTIEDLGSANGVLVNGERLLRARVLTSGDQILIGKQSLLLLTGAAGPELRKAERVTAKTLTNMQLEQEPRTDGERTEATRKGDVLELLGSVVEKVLTLGRGDEAERILSSYLRNLLQAARVNGEVDPAVAEKAAMFAVRIAAATGKGSWVDYVFELYSVVKRPLPAPIVEKLYESIRKLSPVSISGFRQYLSVLRAAEAQFGPSERFLMRRIEGIEALGVLS